jgi:hypothetical protein
MALVEDRVDGAVRRWSMNRLSSPSIRSLQSYKLSRVPLFVCEIKENLPSSKLEANYGSVLKTLKIISGDH